MMLAQRLFLADELNQLGGHEDQREVAVHTFLDIAEGHLDFVVTELLGEVVDDVVHGIGVLVHIGNPP